MADLLAGLRAAKAKAFAASDKASDSGAHTFSTGQNAGKAWGDNRSARKAWDSVVQVGAKLAALPLNNPSTAVQVNQARLEGAEAVEDGNARMGELDVAYEQLLDIGRKNLVLKTKGSQGQTQVCQGVIQPGSSSSTGKKLAIVAVVVGIASKLVGWW